MENQKREWGKGREHHLQFRVTSEVYKFLKARNESPSLAAREIVEREALKQAPHSKKE